MGQGIVGGLAGNGAIAPSVIQILSYKGASGVVDPQHIAQQVPVKIIGGGRTVQGVHHADDAAFVVQIHDLLGVGAFVVISLAAGLSD